MNITNVEHAIYALLMQGAVVLLFWRTGLMSSTAIGGALASGFFIGREHAQREYRIGDPSLLKPWEAFDIWNWSTDAQLDLLFPIGAVVIAVLITRLMVRRRNERRD